MPARAAAQVDLLDQTEQQASSLVNEIGVAVVSVGLNNTARPGEWTGIRVRLNERGTQQRDVLVRVVIPDVDGDDALYEADFTTNPGIEQLLWVYARLPFDLPTTGGFAIRVFEALEAETDSSTGVGLVAGELLGQTIYNWPGNMPGKGTGLLAVVGNTPGGIVGYQQGGIDGINPLGHEVTKIATLTVDSIPDRWMGLAAVRELVWNGPTPSELRVDQVRALREWIERGGHFVVILPATGQDWLALGNQELAAMLPRVSVNRVENEPVSALRPLITDEPFTDLQLPDTPVTIHTFDPMADAGHAEADPILQEASGRNVVVSRSVGVGAVTLVGLPGWDPRLTLRGLPETDVFWHRVLGRRGRIVTTPEENDLKAANQYFDQNRPSLVFDGDISDGISKSGRSLVAVMLGLVVFIVYWLVAGPGGFAFLKQRGISKHAWVGFLAASVAFTALAWGGATLLRPKRVEISHLSYVTHIYGQRVQTVRSWASVLAPVYGNATVWLDSDDAATGGSRFQQAVAPWETSTANVRGTFPDARDYQIDSRSPDRLTFPARATVKQVQLDWAGGLPWSSIRPVVEPEDDPFAAIYRSPPGDQTSMLRGQLIHSLPGELQDVKVILFLGQLDVRTSISKSLLLSSVSAWEIGDWAPDTPLDLALQTPANAASGSRLFDDMLKGNRFGEDALPRADSRTDRYHWLSFFNLFGPPVSSNSFVQSPPVARRDAAHTLDLSRWSTRPCLVVIGSLRTNAADAMPLPLGVATNGREREPVIEGTTIVRWVFPLPTDPPDVFTPTDPADATPGTESP